MSHNPLGIVKLKAESPHFWGLRNGCFSAEGRFFLLWLEFLLWSEGQGRLTRALHWFDEVSHSKSQLEIVFAHGNGSIPFNTHKYSCLGGWTSTNPSYFDVHQFPGCHEHSLTCFLQRWQSLGTTWHNLAPAVSWESSRNWTFAQDEPAASRSGLGGFSGSSSSKDLQSKISKD